MRTSWPRPPVLRRSWVTIASGSTQSAAPWCTPDSVDDRLRRHAFAAASHQQLEHPPLGVGQRDLAAVRPDLAGGPMDPQRAVDEPLDVGSGFRPVGRRGPVRRRIEQWDVDATAAVPRAPPPSRVSRDKRHNTGCSVGVGSADSTAFAPPRPRRPAAGLPSDANARSACHVGRPVGGTTGRRRIGSRLGRGGERQRSGGDWLWLGGDRLWLGGDRLRFLRDRRRERAAA